MGKLLILLTLLTSFGSFAETIRADLIVEVNIPFCRRAGIVNTWDRETEYRVEILEMTQDGTKKLIEKQSKDGHVNFEFNLKNIKIDSNSNIIVDVYEEDSWFYGADDYYPVADAAIDTYSYKALKIDDQVYSTDVYYSSLNQMDCAEIDLRETADSIKSRNR